MCDQCTRSCGGGIQLRSVTCVGGRACLPDDKPTDDQACNVQPCASSTSPDDSQTDDQACNTAGHCPSTSSQDQTGWSTSPAGYLSDRLTRVNSNDITPSNDDRVPSATTTLTDVIPSNDNRILQHSTITTLSEVTTTATAETPTVIPNSAAVPQTTMIITTTTTTTAAATATAAGTVITSRYKSSYRWMALFWDQVSFHFSFFVFNTENG